jgi:hypothetical protein
MAVTHSKPQTGFVRLSSKAVVRIEIMFPANYQARMTIERERQSGEQGVVHLSHRAQVDSKLFACDRNVILTPCLSPTSTHKWNLIGCQQDMTAGMGISHQSLSTFVVPLSSKAVRLRIIYREREG